MVHSPENRELYRSSNGDQWLLARGAEGGKTSDIEIGAFLCERSHGPQHTELLRLIGTLVEKDTDPGGQEPRPPG